MKQLLSDLKIQSVQWRFIAWISLILIIISSLPYLYAWLAAPAGREYLGIHALTAGDMHVYYSYIEQVRGGAFFLQDLYTPELNPAPVFNIFWWSTGLVASLTHLSAPLTFHLVRLILIPLFVIIAYLFISYFFEDKLKRLLSLIFVLFSAGVGGLIAPLLVSRTNDLQWPMDLWVAESNTFLTLYHSPHFIAATGLIILILLFLHLALTRYQASFALLAGFCGLLLFQFHPFHLPTIVTVVGVYLIVLSFQEKSINWRRWGYFIIFLSLSLPAVIYHLALLQFDWLSWQKAYQNSAPSPNLWVLLASYGFLWPLAGLGLFSYFKRGDWDKKKIFLTVWLLVQLSLVVFPGLHFQRRFTQGFHIVLVLLAIDGLFFLYTYWRQRWSKLPNWRFFWPVYTIIFLVLFNFSLLVNLTRDFVLAYDGSEVFYHPKNILNGIRWLKQTPPQSAILAELVNSNFIPGLAVRRVYAGHAIETPFFMAERVQRTWWFFDEKTSDDKRRQFLDSNRINYLFYSKREQDLGNWRPQGKNYLEMVYDKEGVQVYKVKLRN